MSSLIEIIQAVALLITSIASLAVYRKILPPEKLVEKVAEKVVEKVIPVIKSTNGTKP